MLIKKTGKIRNVKAARIIIKIMVLLLASIWGLLLGIGLPLFAMNSGIESAPYSSALIIWLVMTAVGLLAPCFLVMLGKAGIAAAFSAAGTVLTLYIHSRLSEYIYSVAYLPQIFMTILTTLYIFALNPHYITEPRQKRRDKLNAPAPSILEKRKED
jgi:hypothetical protein